MKKLFLTLAILMMPAAAFAAAAPAGKPVPLWTIDHAQSHLTFTGTQEMAPFTGTFGSFDGVIAFDPDNLPASHATITIHMKDVKTGSDERDQNIGQAAWFDSAAFPDSVFTTSSIVKKGAGYVARGKLMLHGVNLPVDLPFTLAITDAATGGKTAKMLGTAEVNRLNFKIGTGDWADPKSVGTKVKIDVALVAVTK